MNKNAPVVGNLDLGVIERGLGAARDYEIRDAGQHLHGERLPLFLPEMRGPLSLSFVSILSTLRKHIGRSDDEW